MKTLLLLAMLAQTTTTDPIRAREYTDGGATFRVYDAMYLSCYDGDTCYFNVLQGFGQVKLNIKTRFCDINAPEIRPLATREAATVARDQLVSWLKEAKRVELHVRQADHCDHWSEECDDQGKFGRYLVYVYALEGTTWVNLNKKLLDQKLVTIFTGSDGKPILCKEGP